MLRYDLFRFIAFELEGVGEPKGDVPTLYGITKKYYPKQYAMIKKAIDSGDEKDLYATIISVYNYIYEHSIAKKFSDYYPLNFNVFDMAFNKGTDDAVYCWQMTYNDVSGSKIAEDGIWGAETENSLDILKFYDTWKLNELYAYNRQIRYMMTARKEDWIEGLVLRVIRLQKHIFEIGK